MNNKRVMIVDALNMYFRAYIVNPSLSINGQPIGGLKGFLGILNKLVREMKPDQIIICWDGAGGSQKRKAVNKNYKEGRSPIRLNRDIRNLSEAEEIANKIWQQTRLFGYLNEMPVMQFLFDHVEADDVIAHLVNTPQLKGSQKVIVSSDKDFFQLLDDETILYRPIQKQFLNKNRIVEEFGIHPTNFALSRAIEGDKSDNLEGIKGVGLGTLAKRFPHLRDQESYTIDSLVEYSCEQRDTGLKCYSLISEQKNLIEENYKLMQLYSPSLSIQAKNIMSQTFEEFKPLLNKTQIIKMFVEDGITDTQIDSLYSNFKKLITEWK